MLSVSIKEIEKLISEKETVVEYPLFSPDK